MALYGAYSADVTLDSSALKDAVVDCSTTWDGSEFQSPTVRTAKEWLNACAEEPTARNLNRCIALSPYWCILISSYLFYLLRCLSHFSLYYLLLIQLTSISVIIRIMFTVWNYESSISMRSRGCHTLMHYALCMTQDVVRFVKMHTGTLWTITVARKGNPIPRDFFKLHVRTWNFRFARHYINHVRGVLRSHVG